MELTRSDFERAFSSGEWFMFPRCLLLVLSFGESILLSHLINKARSVRASEKYGGWFYCLMNSIVDDLNISVDQQTSLFQSLKRKGYVVTERRGLPAKRYIWIDYVTLMGDIGNAENARNSTMQTASEIE